MKDGMSLLHQMRRYPVTDIERLEQRRLLSIEAVGPEFRVNTYTTRDQTHPSVAMDSAGDFVVAWYSQSQDGSGYGIYSQRYNAAGVAQGAEFRANTFTTAHQLLPSVAMDADGDFVVAWSSVQDGSSGGIYAQRYDAAGVAQGAEFRVNTFTTGDQFNVAVAMDADGDFVVAWESSGQDGSGGGIYAQRYNAAGVPQDLEFRVNSFTTGGQRIPATAMDADGDFVVTWYDYSQDCSGFGIYAQRYNAAGTAQGGEFRVNSFTNGHQRLPSVAMDADGDFVVAWQSAYQDGSAYGVYAQRYSAAGVAQGIEFRVNSYTTSGQADPSVAIEADGDFVVAWVGNQDSDSNVYAQRYNAAGVALGAEFRVNRVTIGSQQFPAVGMDADGDFVVTWTDGTFAFNGQDGSLGGIFAQRYAVVPTVTASSFTFATAPHRLQFTFDEDVSASLGTDDLLVENLTTGQTIPADAFVVTYDAPHNRATFSHIGSGGGDAVLPDGNYRATLRAAGIHTPNGNTLPADHVLEFRFLTGDANNDGAVNLQDFNILAANFGQAPRDFTQGDFNYDGVVNLIDFNILAGRFGAQLAPMASPATAPAQSRWGRPHLDDDLEDLLS